MKIAIIVLNYNSRDLTIRCLESIKELQLPKSTELETIVVDNDSNDGSVNKIGHQFPSAHIIALDENTGFAKGNNIGVAKALEHQVDYIMILNNDTYLDSSLLHHLLEGFKHHPQAAIVSPKIYFAPGHEFHKLQYTESQKGQVIWFAGGQMDWDNLIGSNIGVDQVDQGQFDEDKQIQITTGCCLLVKSSIITNQKLFDERYFMYYEDADLSMRIRQKNHQIWYIHQAKMWHVNAASSGSGSDLQDYYITRNRMLFGMQYAPWRTKLALYRQGLKLMFTGRPWQKIGIHDYFKRDFGPGSYFNDSN